MIERSCRLATRFAEGLRRPGYQILNEVRLNQVIASFGDAATTRRVIAAVQYEGPAGAAEQSGTARRPCGSAFRAGRPRKTMSTAAWQ